MFGSRARGDASPRCRRGQHRLRTDRLLLCHPTVSDLRVAAAAASDRLAQRWLGWRPEQVIAEGLCAGLLAQRAGGGFHWAPIDSGWLIAVDTASGRIAGAVTVTGEQHEIGGWLAPQFRGRGLGRELFHGAVIFAHDHLAMATVLAGTERTNAACVGALLSAGFVATTGPARHRLPDGRTVPSQWFRHDTDEPRYCR